ncbi:hypothetical protein [Breznakia pachnodae]|uniref:Uncharacterized protein n=1 Tax=Breznakia pachnodae TaxID=265178 RepID=A0ABU0E963_9FIRM|nr:hypothetical protein [Breznakia pachnodae]MDQ0363248.1 hypothetical protein [Breznakia pachnodae]
MLFDKFIDLVKGTHKHGGEITMAVQTVKDLENNNGLSDKEKTELDKIIESYGIDVNLIDYEEYDSIDEPEEILTLDNKEEGAGNET